MKLLTKFRVFAQFKHDDDDALSYRRYNVKLPLLRVFHVSVPLVSFFWRLPIFVVTTNLIYIFIAGGPSFCHLQYSFNVL